jgi:S1-C subfamily serine protease
VVTSLPLGEQSLGGGIFNLEGDLLGLVLQCEDGPLAVTPDGVDAILNQAASFEGRLLRRYGFRVRELDERDREYFGAATGALVTEICVGGLADQAGIGPGDIIGTLDDAPVGSPDDLARLVLPVTYPSFDIVIRRRGRSERLELQASDTDFGQASDATTHGIELGAPPEGFLIGHIVPDSPAAQALLEPGDRLLTVNGRAPRSPQDAAKTLAGTDEEAFVVVRRGDRRLGAFLR